MKRVLIEKPTYGSRQAFRVAKPKRKSKWLLAGVILITGVFSLLPDFHLERYLGTDYTWWFDMMQHGGYYVLLTLILFFLFPYQKRTVSFFLLIFFVSVIFEIIQIWIPERNFSLLDITSNFLGITVAFILNYIYYYLKT